MIRLCEFPGCCDLTDADGFNRERHGAIPCNRHFREVAGGLLAINPEAHRRVCAWARENMIDGKTRRGEA